MGQTFWIALGASSLAAAVTALGIYYGAPLRDLGARENRVLHQLRRRCADRGLLPAPGARVLRNERHAAAFLPHRDSAVFASESESLPTPAKRAGMLEILFGTA